MPAHAAAPTSPAFPPAPELNRCDACHGPPQGGALVGVVQGVGVVMCAWPTPCRERAQKIGIWKRYR